MSVPVTDRIGTLRRELAATLERRFAIEGGQGTAALDARILLANAIGVEAAGLALHDDEPIDPEAQARAVASVERRLAGEPVARIIGRREFWGLDIEIGPDVLVPRPDTETLVEAVLSRLIRDGRRGDPLRLLDIATGSGAILLALLSELPTAIGAATDCVVGAIDIARANARRLGLDKRAGFVACDWASAIGGRFDFILANPPYIESDAIANLQVEVRDHDPHIALDGGADGIDAYRAILADLGRLLAERGRCFLEIGFGQAGSLTDLAGQYGFSARLHRDIAGIDRVVEIVRIEES